MNNGSQGPREVRERMISRAAPYRMELPLTRTKRLSSAPDGRPSWQVKKPSMVISNL